MTRQCQQCNKPFNTYAVIDGIRRRLCSRHRCLDCSPFQDKRPHPKSAPGMKFCLVCSKEKSVKEFAFIRRRNRELFIFNHCKECEKEKQKIRLQKHKQKCVTYKGGACQECGYRKCINSLHFHHVNPALKEFSISRVRKIQWDLLKLELDKCALVCANCHGEIHAGLLAIKERESLTTPTSMSIIG